ncbi:hypothetical protein IEQ34_005530 [Dendrobium chrysotoxum]|uniref:Uncharacterized protein n=1 Tax=Dendrobium chrysotoxum TaxID=161865 RepID=A0AAV7HAF0_DENCH|nr:hypothetical protein IEQ34_005530 [Dendrobium chrysotoxum]
MFESIVAGGDLTCGLIIENFTVICCKAERFNISVIVLPLPKILTGICVPEESTCKCGIFHDSESLCSGSGIKCKPCGAPTYNLAPLPAHFAAQTPTSATKNENHRRDGPVESSASHRTREREILIFFFAVG